MASGFSSGMRKQERAAREARSHTDRARHGHAMLFLALALAADPPAPTWVQSNVVSPSDPATCKDAG
jgi:hypothetical protein